MTQAQVFSKKRSSKIFFQAISKKKKEKKRSPKVFFWRSRKEINKKAIRKFPAKFLAFLNKILTIQKIVLSSS